MPLHVEILIAQLKNRILKNPRYTLRAFAQFLNIDVDALALILSGHRELPLASAIAVIEKLNLSVSDARVFIASVAEDRRMRASNFLVRALEPSALPEDESAPTQGSLIDPIEGEALHASGLLSPNREHVAVVDRNHRVLHCNEAFSKFLSVNPCELIGRTWFDTRLGEEMASEFQRQEKAAFEAAIPLRYSYNFGAGAARKVFERDLYPIRNESHAVEALLCIARDITWQEFIADSTLRLLSSSGLTSCIATLSEIGLPLLGEACVLSLKDGDGHVVPVSITSISGRGDSAKQFNHDQPLSSVSHQHLSEMEIENKNHLEKSAHFDFGAMKVRSLIRLPLIDKDRAFGSLIYLSPDTSNFASLDKSDAIRQFARMAASVLNVNGAC